MTRPDPIRTDHSNPFANHTMRVRVPETIQNTIDTNPDYPPSIRDALARLRDEIAGDAPIRPVALPAPDFDEWTAIAAPYMGDTWHNTVWFFAEVYTYRLIIEAVRWWETGRDPFWPIKRAEEESGDLWPALEEVLTATGPNLPADQRILKRLHSALWGNRIDLSFKWSLERGTDVVDSDLLVDDSPAIVRQLLAGRGPVHLVADNYGRELAFDLALVDALLDGVDDRVFLHVKFHPTFVSDATVSDVRRFLMLAADRSAAIGDLADRLADALNTGRLRLVPDPYWNSTRYLWELPPRLRQLFAGSRLVLVKGDLNYRRLVGDAIWPEGTSFAEAVRGFPAPIAALRALKSDPIVGLPVGMAARLDAEDPDWHWNGKRGVLQASL
ncbi:MAG: damage-control phosphatase ARMT1 family protein [Anaerolineae bacterium]